MISNVPYVPIALSYRTSPLINCGYGTVQSTVSKALGFLEPFALGDEFKPVVPTPQPLHPVSARHFYLKLLGSLDHHQQRMSPDKPTPMTKRTTPYKSRLVSFDPCD